VSWDQLLRVNKDIEALRKKLEEKNAQISEIRRELEQLRRLRLELKCRVYASDGGHKTNRSG
jgi:hypothetical protein